MIVVHHLNNSRSQRILWLLEELELPYEVRHYERGADMKAPAELRRVHALGKSPVIVDDDGAGTKTVVAESAAIIDYILDKFGAGRLRPPEGSPELLKYKFWMYFAEGSAMPPLLLTLIFNTMVKAKKPFFIQPIVKALAAKVHASFIDPNVKSQFDYMEKELSEHSWFAGAQFSAADIMMSFPLEAGRSRGAVDANRPHLVKFLSEIHARPAYRRAIDRGGTYAYDS